MVSDQTATDNGSHQTKRRVLNLGSGARPVPGAVNLDSSPAANPEVLHDLARRPWPFADDTFEEILGYDILEHLDDVVGFMEEVHRIGRPGAILRLTVPHFSSANSWRDPTHVRAFAHGTLDYFTEGHPFSFYSKVRFARLRTTLQFHPSLTSRVVQRLANRWPTAYEDRWAWVFPAWFIYYEFRVIK